MKRRYDYDEETELYYLRSRYFSPTCIRFINSDIIYIRNTYAYCSNSPLILKDDSGYAPTSSVFFAHAVDGGAASTPPSSNPIDGKYYVFTLEEEQRVAVQGYVHISHAKVQSATRDGVTEIYVGLYIGSVDQFEFHFVDRATGTVYAGRIDVSKCILGDEVGRAEFYFGPEDMENTGSGVRWQSYNIQNAINNMIRKGAFKYSEIALDGVFGSGTTSAVKALQKQNGLLDDGIVGPLTRELLLPYAIKPYTEVGG